MSQQVFTIGVYGTSESTFFKSLVDNGVTHFVDVRRRRGMRGSQYAYANATALQTKLRELGIEYVHHLEFSPTKEMREAQKAIDASSGTTKTSRIELGGEFVRRYQIDCLGKLDASALLWTFPETARLALFCVENRPQACHRSLLANWIQQLAGIPWLDITPAEVA